MSNEDKIKSVLSDLGRATLRGVRKCPKCGTYNGIRGISCKNKKCDVVFKEIDLKRKLSSDAVKLLTGTSTQVYSVRVRDRGPEHRGFVQLPFVQTQLSALGGLDSTINIFSETSALCFVDTCQRLFDTSILKCHEATEQPNDLNDCSGSLLGTSDLSSLSTTSCVHIQAAIKCVNKATPLALPISILSSLNVSNEIKQGLLLLVTEAAGPLVQRVSKNCMAVKCQISPKHPLGYLHFSFITTKSKDRLDHRYICSCNDFKSPVETITTSRIATKNKSSIMDVYPITNNNNNAKKCIHYFACICAFASDPGLSEEFDYYVKLEKVSGLSTTLSSTGTLIDDLSEDVTESLVSMFNADFSSSNATYNIEVLTDQKLSDVPNLVIGELDTNQSISDGEITIIRGLDSEILNMNDLSDNYISLSDNVHNDFIEISELKRFLPASSLKVPTSKRARISSNSHNSRNSNCFGLKDNLKINKIPNSARKLRKATAKQVSDPNEERPVSWSFLEWLASVTETINQTMHFQYDGKPEPLHFLVPQHFFECLRERISFGLTKKRLPNFTQSETRRTRPPYGTFIKYVWHIINIFQLKQIFETPLVSLEITRGFYKNGDGSYAPCVSCKEEELTETNGSFVPIKPFEFNTYLKVGKTAADQNDPTPFIIEWIPDIMPQTKLGEMNLIFEYGHS